MSNNLQKMLLNIPFSVMNCVFVRNIFVSAKYLITNAAQGAMNTLMFLVPWKFLNLSG